MTRRAIIAIATLMVAAATFGVADPWQGIRRAPVVSGEASPLIPDPGGYHTYYSFAITATNTTQTLDVSGHARHASNMVASPVFSNLCTVGGQVNYGQVFNGSRYLKADLPTQMLPSASGSLVYWIRPAAPDFIGANNTICMGIIAFKAVPGVGIWSGLLRNGGNVSSAPFIAFYSSSGYQAFPTAALYNDTNNWLMIGATWTNNNACLWTNGVWVTNDLSCAFPAFDPAENYIGGGAYYSALNGQLDEIRVWDRVITGAEITNAWLYSNPTNKLWQE